MMAKRGLPFGLALPVGAVALLAALWLAAPASAVARDRFDRGGLWIVSVSNPHPDLVSGGEVLLRVSARPAAGPPIDDHAQRGRRNL